MSFGYRCTCLRGNLECGSRVFRKEPCISYDRTVTWRSLIRVPTRTGYVNISLDVN
jgi:hypothetical protein